MSKAFEPCEGGCTCGEIRYRVDVAPLIVHACHCRWCQRQTGGPHVINALYEAERVELLQGEPEIRTIDSPSGEGQIIARCPTCRVAVWSNYHFGGLRERIRFLRAGTLDDPDRMPPDVHIFTASKMPWYILPPDHLAVEEYYDTASTWSKESLERYKAWRASDA